ncbi:hypothetical protein RQP46_011264 [Phenoliferia psychrophenolica]
MPVLASTVAATSTNSFYTFLPAISTSDASSSYTVVSYLRLLAMPSGYVTTSAMKTIARGPQSFIYASSTIKPDSTAENAVLTQHNQAHSSFSLDLSTAITLDATSNSSTSTSSGDAIATASVSRSKRDMYLIAHATVGSLGLLLFSPMAILIARLFRGSTWFPAHAALNLLAAALVVTAFALGYTQVHRIGIALLVLILVQVVFGAFAHRTKASPHPSSRLPTLSGKSPVRLVHIVLGVTILGLGLYQVHEGLEEYPDNSDGGETVPRGVFIVYYILISIIAASYLAGWIKEFLGKNQPAGMEGKGVEKVSSY